MELTNPEQSAPAEVAVAPPAPDLEATGPKTLGDRMALQRQYRAMLVDPNFDPARDIGRLAKIEGDVETNVEAIMVKIDNTVGWIRSCDDYATNCRNLAARLIAEADAAQANADKSRAYVEYQMSLENTKELVGREFVLRQRRKGGNPTVVTTREPTAEDLVSLGEGFVRTIPAKPVTYAWDKKAICKALKDIEGTVNVQGPLTSFAGLSYDEEIIDEPIGKPQPKARKKKGGAS